MMPCPVIICKSVETHIFSGLRRSRVIIIVVDSDIVGYNDTSSNFYTRFSANKRVRAKIKMVANFNASIFRNAYTAQHH